ncbi:3-phosphoshikimate 1-carboxyvinyltransferase [bacterium]|nr:3-phosphoshikimate 1-carboxyvinyltransferase [bacterium]
MHCIIEPSVVSGEVYIPPSKSETMRAIIFAAMARGTSHIQNILLSPDTFAMLEGVEAFGAKIKLDGNCVQIEGVAGKPTCPDKVIDVGNSGLALRFLLSLASLVKGEVFFTGDTSIKTRRPVKPLLDVYKKAGMKTKTFAESKDGYLSIKGRLVAGSMMIEGEDSQPVSSLLFSAAFLEGPSEIYVIQAGEKPFVDLTMHWLESVGIGVHHDDYQVFEVDGRASYPGFSLTIGGDYSTALFPLAGALVTGGKMVVHGLDPESKQGDRKALDIFRDMGAKIAFREDKALVGHLPGKLYGVDVDINHCIDVLPILSVVATFAHTRTLIKGAEIARWKESNRIAVMVEQLSEMGARVEEKQDGILIYPSSLLGAHLSGMEDHRVVMSLMVAAAGASGKSMIEGPEALVKTYPTGIYDFMRCGWKIELKK